MAMAIPRLQWQALRTAPKTGPATLPGRGRGGAAVVAWQQKYSHLLKK